MECVSFLRVCFTVLVYISALGMSSVIARLRMQCGHGLTGNSARIQQLFPGQLGIIVIG